jgi:hypothetical protein
METHRKYWILHLLVYFIVSHIPNFKADEREEFMSFGVEIFVALSSISILNPALPL